MADKTTSLRPNSSQKSKTKMNNMVKTSDNLQSREAEYQKESNRKKYQTKSNSDSMESEPERRLNEELEAKTAKLVNDAEEMLKLDFREVQKCLLLDNVETEDSSLEEDTPHGEIQSTMSARSKSRNTSLPPSGSHTPSGDRKLNSSRPSSKHKTQMKLPRKNNASDVALVAAEKRVIKDFSLERTISSIEGRIDQAGMESHVAVDMADVIPASACEMGSEAQIRFLKAKLRVMQEELTRVSRDCCQKEQERLTMKSDVKHLEDEKVRNAKTISSLKGQLSKYEHISDESRNKTLDLETELMQLRKEMTSISQTHQKTASTKSITEVRLNRAIEEVERYKKEVASYKASLQDASVMGEKKMEYLTNENKRLENQKKELMVAFKKQMKLIDLYKRQKMHVEAAKMLSFSEDEFLSALEWGK